MLLVGLSPSTEKLFFENLSSQISSSKKTLSSALYLGEIVAGQYCSGCTNSLGVAIVKDKDGEEVILSSLSDTHSVVFFDSKKNNAKLGCGEITNGLLVETS